MPPISKLSADQALYHFISGYTAKVAGTEKGVKEPSSTFSTCFGGPFMPLHPSVYAELLKKEIQEKGVVTTMCQGKYDIQRSNPALNQYNTMIKNFSSTIKQLNELLPKETTTSEDDLEEFLDE